jgi:sugar/nucleoside kinase (ribokinase family)
MLDVLAMLPGPLAIGSDTPAPVSFTPGGAGANTAAWLAATGTPSAFVGRVGDDAFGRDLVEGLHRVGVQAAVGIDPRSPTGVCLVLVGPDGERTMIPSAGANAALSTVDVDSTTLSSRDRLHLSGYTLFHPGSRAAARYAIERALASKTPISVDAASAGPLRSAGAQTFLDWLPRQLLLLANAEEARVLTGAAEPADAARLLSERFTEVVVKCGAEGATIAVAGDASAVTGRQVAVVDSTGAGDAFAAGVLGGLLDGQPLAVAVARGNDFGARAVSRVGARPPELPN